MVEQLSQQGRSWQNQRRFYLWLDSFYTAIAQLLKAAAWKIVCAMLHPVAISNAIAVGLAKDV